MVRTERPECKKTTSEEDQEAAILNTSTLMRQVGFGGGSMPHARQMTLVSNSVHVRCTRGLETPRAL